jgi:hypothetical protein
LAAICPMACMKAGPKILPNSSLVTGCRQNKETQCLKISSYFKGKLILTLPCQSDAPAHVLQYVSSLNNPPRQQKVPPGVSQKTQQPPRSQPATAGLPSKHNRECAAAVDNHSGQAA